LWYYAEHEFTVMLNSVRVSAVMLSVVMLGVDMLSVIILRVGKLSFRSLNVTVVYACYARNLEMFVMSLSVCPWSNKMFASKARAYRSEAPFLC
jgi:hypothetical protein